jgi:hypothetical protein
VTLHVMPEFLINFPSSPHQFPFHISMLKLYQLNLYEDELHDFGDMSVSAKIRVMPTCWYLLTRCFVRVDGVAIKCVESRIFHKFK